MDTLSAKPGIHTLRVNLRIAIEDRKKLRTTYDLCPRNTPRKKILYQRLLDLSDKITSLKVQIRVYEAKLT